MVRRAPSSWTALLASNILLFKLLTPQLCYQLNLLIPRIWMLACFVVTGSIYAMAQGLRDLAKRSGWLVPFAVKSCLIEPHGVCLHLQRLQSVCHGNSRGVVRLHRADNHGHWDLRNTFTSHVRCSVRFRSEEHHLPAAWRFGGLQWNHIFCRRDWHNSLRTIFHWSGRQHRSHPHCWFANLLRFDSPSSEFFDLFRFAVRADNGFDVNWSDEPSNSH